MQIMEATGYGIRPHAAAPWCCFVYSCPPATQQGLLPIRGATQPPGPQKQGTPSHACTRAWPEPHETPSPSPPPSSSRNEQIKQR
jgi:hypothetical protein